MQVTVIDTKEVAYGL